MPFRAKVAYAACVPLISTPTPPMARMPAAVFLAGKAHPTCRASHRRPDKEGNRRHMPPEHGCVLDIGLPPLLLREVASHVSQSVLSKERGASRAAKAAEKLAACFFLPVA
jgi:hypothetical protein